MTEASEREVLEALARRVWGWCEAPAGVDPYEWAYRWARLSRLLDVKAYLDAALMLVPRGWIVEIVRSFDDDGAFFSTVKLTDSFTIGRGCDPDEEVSVTARKGAITTFHDPTALALCAAIEAAIAREGE